MRSPPIQRGESLAGLVTFNDLLIWFKERVANDAALSDSWKRTVRTVIDRHLLPRLGELPIGTLTAATLDKYLMWPVQAECSTSYVRQIFRVLSLATGKARELGLIASNPMAEMKFKHFIKTKILPKDGRLRADHLGEVVPALGALFELAPADAMLALLMICHGTRLGERQPRPADRANAGEGWAVPRRSRPGRILESERDGSICGEQPRTRSRHFGFGQIETVSLGAVDRASRAPPSQRPDDGFQHRTTSLRQ